MGGGLRSWSVGSWWNLRETEVTQPPPLNSPRQELRQHWGSPEAEPEATQAGVGFPAEEFCDNQQCKGGVCFTPVASRMVRLKHQEMTAPEGQTAYYSQTTRGGIRPRPAGPCGSTRVSWEAEGEPRAIAFLVASTGRRVRLGARSGLAGLGDSLGSGAGLSPVPGPGIRCRVWEPTARLGGGRWTAGLHLKVYLWERRWRELFTVSRS